MSDSHHAPVHQDPPAHGHGFLDRIDDLISAVTGALHNFHGSISVGESVDKVLNLVGVGVHEPTQPNHLPQHQPDQHHLPVVHQPSQHAIDHSQQHYDDTLHIHTHVHVECNIHW